MKSVFLRAAVVVALATVSGVAVNFGQITAVWHQQAVQSAEDYAPRPVELDFVLSWQQQGKLIVDARSRNNYLDGHLSGAYSVPVGDQQRLQAVVDCCGQSAQVLVYCSSITCSDSFTLGEQLFISGFTQVYLYEGGFADWLQHGQALVSGAHRQSDTAQLKGGQQ